jgi:hypothetical protein
VKHPIDGGVGREPEKVRQRAVAFAGNAARERRAKAAVAAPVEEPGVRERQGLCPAIVREDIRALAAEVEEADFLGACRARPGCRARAAAPATQ